MARYQEDAPRLLRIFWIHWLLLLALLLLPSPLLAAPCEYVVQPGDTLAGIATRTGSSLAALLQANPTITNPNLIHTGQSLTLPDCQGSPDPAAPPIGDGRLPESPPPPQVVPPPPADLAASAWKLAHDATITIRHPIEAPRFSGSGIVVGSDGRTFITAYHVIGDPLTGEEATHVSIGPFGDWHYTADVIATDPGLDLAILRVREPDFPGFAIAPIGSAGELSYGEPIYTLSYPGIEGKLMTGKGTFLGTVRSFHNRAPLLLTDAIAQSGSSGGVAVNARGEVIGIISALIIGKDAMEMLGFSELTQVTLIVPIDSAGALLARAGVR